MRRIKLYIAASIDGRIAGTDGDIGWLDRWNNTGDDYGYSDFMNSVDTTLMGNRTYKQVLAFEGDFPYGKKENYVFTRDSTLKDDENVKYISDNHLEVIKTLKNQPGKDIWLIGGSKINSFFLQNRLIDDLLLFIIPVFLGDGIPLFENSNDMLRLELTEQRLYINGVTQLNYTIKNA